MGHIREPKGVDFIIKSEPLTDSERALISAFIKRDKSKQQSSVKVKRSSKKTKVLS